MTARLGFSASATGLALAVVLALVWATPGVTHAETEPPSTTVHVSAEDTTLTNEDGEDIGVTKITTVVNIDFGDILLPAGIDPSSITVTLDGVPLDFTKHVFTFNNQRLSVTIEEWREAGTVTVDDLEERQSAEVEVSYVQPADPGDERLRYASGSDVKEFAVTATPTSKEAADASFVVPVEPKTVTAIIRGNASPTKSQTVSVEPVGTRDTDTSAPTGEKVADIVRQICKELGGSNCS